MKKLLWIDRLEYMEGLHLYIITFRNKEYIFTFQTKAMRTQENEYPEDMEGAGFLKGLLVVIALIFLGGSLILWAAN